MSAVVAWHGLPLYAAKLIAATSSDEISFVIATKPKVPIEGMEQAIPGRIKWIKSNEVISFSSLGIPTPSVFFQPSWSFPVFNRLGDEVIKNGGKIVLMFDNRWRGDIRQFLGALNFRVLNPRKYSAAWVPGVSGRRLAKYWGFHSSSIFLGMYGADPTTFSTENISRLHTRSKRMIFVGRLVKEKGVSELMSAWRDFCTQNKDWELHIYGCGPLENEVRDSSAIYHGFQQPNVIAEALRQSRFLILPSHDEHWGLVACEAAQSGCGLLLSNAVGSHQDLLAPLNGQIFPAKRPKGILSALRWAATRDSDALDAIYNESITRGMVFTPFRWASEFRRIMKFIS